MISTPRSEAAARVYTATKRRERWRRRATIGLLVAAVIGDVLVWVW